MLPWPFLHGSWGPWGPKDARCFLGDFQGKGRESWWNFVKFRNGGLKRGNFWDLPFGWCWMDGKECWKKTPFFKGWKMLVYNLLACKMRSKSGGGTPKTERIGSDTRHVRERSPCSETHHAWNVVKNCEWRSNHIGESSVQQRKWLTHTYTYDIHTTNIVNFPACCLIWNLV